MPYHRSLYQACFALALHGSAAADAGDYRAALADACAVSLLARACHQEPHLLCHLVALTGDTIAFELAWNVLRSPSGSLTEPDLHHLQKVLGGVNAEQSYLQAVRGEMIIGLKNLDLMAGDPVSRSKVTHGVSTSGMHWLNFVEMIPASYFVLNKATLAEAEMEFLIRPLKAGGLVFVLEMIKECKAFWIFLERVL